MNQNRFSLKLVCLALAAGTIFFAETYRGKSAADTTAAVEYKIKGGYLFNFAKFIDWPTNAFPTQDSPFIIGVLDSGEALTTFTTLLNNRTLNGHPIQVREINPAAIDRSNHILFVNRNATKSLKEILTALDNAPTLLVGESAQFAEHGGMVGFVREEDSIRITLNLERANEAGLKVSAKLSSIAKLVKTAK